MLFVQSHRYSKATSAVANVRGNNLMADAAHVVRYQSHCKALEKRTNTGQTLKLTGKSFI